MSRLFISTTIVEQSGKLFTQLQLQREQMEFQAQQNSEDMEADSVSNWSKVCTFVVLNTMPDQVFWTNQTATIYKQLVNLATQKNLPKDINKLTMEEIISFMKEQFDLKPFIV